MRTEKLRGLWVAALTPLAADGRIDTGLLASHCRWLFTRGVDGVAVFDNRDTFSYTNASAADAGPGGGGGANTDNGVRYASTNGIVIIRYLFQ